MTQRRNHENTFNLQCFVLCRLLQVKGQSSINFTRITVNGKRATISLKRKVPISDLDTHKHRARRTNQKTRILNNYLGEVYRSLFNRCQDLKNEHKPITSQAIKERFIGEYEQNHSVLDVID